MWNRDGTRLHVGGQDGTLRTLDAATWDVLSEHVLAADMTALRLGRLTADGKQKISLGRGLVREDVSAVLFDEPLTVIDPHLKWQLRRKLEQRCC